MAEARVRFPWGLTVATGLALVLLCGLGTWQVQRLQWKEALIAEADAAAKASPKGLSAFVQAAPQEFSRLVLTCRGLDTAPYVELQTIHEGQPGVRLISLCNSETFRLGGETHRRSFLIDRGFIPEGVSARPPQQVTEKPVAMTAQLRTPSPANGMTPPPEGRRFYARDLDAMSRVLHDDYQKAGALRSLGPLGYPYILYATTSSNPDWAALQPSAPPAAFSNNHLGYALTWFGLALALAGTYVALLRRKLGPSTPSADTEKSSS